jgi:succinate-semialdehyde dehydrogenase/glutarate-semialdehyde dehydrogenase
VAALFRFHDEQEAVEAANASDVGLAASLRMRDLSRSVRVSRALETGVVGIDEGLITTKVAPFGGVKDSGISQKGARQGIDEFLHANYLCLGL